MKPLKSLTFWLFLLLLLILFVSIYNTQYGKDYIKIDFSTLIQKVKMKKVVTLTFKGNEVIGEYLDDEGKKVKFKTYGPANSDYYQKLFAENDLIPNYEKEREASIWQMILIQWFPMLLLFFLLILFMRQMQVGGGKAMSFGKSKARLLNENVKRVTFDNVAGIDDAKEELEEIIEFLREPKKFTKLGGRIPKGVLLMGSPGTGKTLLAKAIAGEAKVPFFSISGSDFVEMFVGVGAARVRDLFEQGKKHAPCIIFIDEIDAVGRLRGSGLGGGHDEREQTLNQLLVEMDGFESNEGVIIIAATNRPDVLDPALLRPGRFDRRVMIPRPDINGRIGILRVHTKNKKLADDVDLEVLARGTPGFSGADLENLVNEAALLAARRNKDAISLEDFEMAKDKVLMGSERRTMIISEEEKKNTAFHEAGHALLTQLLPGADPLHKVTIIPRGMALGLTQQLPISDKYTYSRDYLLTNLTIMMGGRVAEEIAFNRISSGAGNDIERATEIARKMVCEWGMSETLGPLSFGKKDEAIFLGKEFAMHKDYSEKTAEEIDNEIKRFVMDAYLQAKEIIGTHKDILYSIANKLIEKESLDGEDVEGIIRSELEKKGMSIDEIREKYKHRYPNSRIRGSNDLESPIEN